MDGESPSSESARRDAEAWMARLGRPEVTPEQRRAFRDWLHTPANALAWRALEAGRARRDRYVVRPETERFKVVDIWTGETAVIAMTPQDGLSEDDARHTARLLNRRAVGGDRTVLQ